MTARTLDRPYTFTPLRYACLMGALQICSGVLVLSPKIDPGRFVFVDRFDADWFYVGFLVLVAIRYSVLLTTRVCMCARGFPCALHLAPSLCLYCALPCAS